MDADMIAVPSRVIHSCALLLCMIPAVTIAQSLPDPTRPPDTILSPVDQQARKDNGLQSVIISPARRAAIINGQTVELGGKLGEARLVEVNESYVVLRNAEGKQVLSMFEGVKIRKSVPPVPESSAAKHTMQKKQSLKKKKSAGKHAHQVKPPTSNEGDGK